MSTVLNAENPNLDENGNPVPKSNAGGALSASSSAAPIPGNQNKQGSGRFTNLNKYVAANQQGSANLANRLGTGIQNQLTSSENEASGNIKKVAGEVTTGRGKVSDASGQEANLKAISDNFKTGGNFKVLDNNRGKFGEGQQNLSTFYKAPTYSQFKDAQSGKAVDEANLQNLQDVASRGANAYQDLFKQREGQVGSVEGRKSALNEFIGGKGQAIRPAYSSGQSKLDQLVLGQNNQSLRNLINTVGANKANVQTALSDVSKTGTDVTDLINDESNLISNIGNTAKDLQKNFYSALDDPNKLSEVDSARQSAFKTASSDLQGGTVSDTLYNTAGLGTLEDQGIYTALDNADLGTENRLSNEYFKRKAGPLKYEDIASQEDVNTDAAIADILGGAASPRFTKAGDISTNADWMTGASGGNSLLERLQSEQASQLEKAKNTNLSAVNPYERVQSYEQNVYDTLRGAGHDTINDTMGGNPLYNSVSGGVDVTSASPLSSLYNNLGQTMADRSNRAAGMASNVEGLDDFGRANVANKARTSVAHRYNQLKDYISANKYGNNLKRKS